MENIDMYGLTKQIRDKAINSNTYTQIEIVTCKDEMIPYCHFETRGCSRKEVALAIKSIEGLIKALIQRDPMLVVELEKFKIDKCFVVDTNKNKDEKIDKNIGGEDEQNRR